MDDNEFRIRAFSEPGSEDPDLHEAARGDSTRQRLMQEIAELEEHITSAVSTVTVPSGLADRLKEQIETESGSGGWNPMRFFTVAAMVVIAAVITLVPDFTNQPSARDAAFRDTLVTHLHDEASLFEGASRARWADVTTVLAAAGMRPAEGEPPLSSAPLTFTRHCDLGEAGRAVHIVIEGEQGPISVILSSNEPVERVITVEDEHFHGRIVPTEHGNMTIIGEQGEALSGLQTMVANSVEWSI